MLNIHTTEQANNAASRGLSPVDDSQTDLLWRFWCLSGVLNASVLLPRQTYRVPKAINLDYFSGVSLHTYYSGGIYRGFISQEILHYVS